MSVACSPIWRLVPGCLVALVLLPSSLFAQVDSSTRQQNDETETWLVDTLGAQLVRNRELDHAPIIEVVMPEIVTHGWADPETRSRGRMTGEVLQRLGQIRELESLELSGTRFENAHLVHLQGLDSLRHLGLRRSGLDVEGIRHVAALQSLQSLDVTRTGKSQTGFLEWVGKLKNLKQLRVDGGAAGSAQNNRAWIHDLRFSLSTGSDRLGRYRGGVGDQDLPGLAGLDLTRLSLSGTPVSDAGVKQIVEMFPNLRQLDLSRTAVRDPGLERISKLNSLQELNLGYTAVSSDGVKALSSLEHLEYLDLHACPVPGEAIAALGSLKNLEFLDLSHSLLGDNAVPSIAGIPELKEIRIEGTGVGFSGICKIAREHPHLDLTSLLVARGWAQLNEQGDVVSLKLRKQKIGDEHIATLQAFPSLVYLDLGNNRVTNEGLGGLSSLVNLKWLDLNENPIDDMGIARLAPLERLESLSTAGTGVTLHGVHALFVDGQARSAAEAMEIVGVRNEIADEDSWDFSLVGREVDDDELGLVGGLKTARYLKLTDNPVSDAGIARLADLDFLQVLWLEDVDVTGDSLEIMAALPSLEVLWCPGLEIANQDLKHLTSAPRLRVLNLCGCPVNGDSVEWLRQIPTLRTLIVDCDTFDASAARRLEQFNPEISVIRSQWRVLEQLRGRQRVLKTLGHGGSTMVEEHAGIRSEIPRDPLVGRFGDKYFEQASQICVEGRRRSCFDDHWERLKYLETARSVRFTGLQQPLPEGVFAQLNLMPQLESLDLGNTDPGPNRLYDIQRVGELTELALRVSAVGAEMEAGLPTLAGLKSLRLSGNQSLLPDFSLFEKMPALQRLTIDCTNADQDDLELISSLKQLEYLDIGFIDIDSIEPLTGLECLEVLVLSGTRVSDDAFPVLEQMPSLKRVVLRDTRVSDAGVAAFLEKRPEVEIRR